MGGHQIKNPSHSFPDTWRNVIQEVLHTPLAPLPIPRRRFARAQRNTRWMLWIPHRDLDIHQQSTTSWLLLAPHETGCAMVGEQMCEIPKACHPHTPPVEPLNVMLSPCPFSQWGMYIVGLFPLATGQRKFLLVAIDYFTKLVETEPLARITEREVMKFVWKNIIYRFGLSREIILDNSRKFQGRRIQDWCIRLRIKQRFTSVSHPQANRQFEVTNQILVQGIKKRLDRAGGNWVKKLTSILSSYQTTPRGSTRKNPFTLEQGTETVIPTELGMPSHRILYFNEESNSQLLKEHLDLVDELRETAFIQMERYKSTMINAHNKRVKVWHF
ncbi:hypothetical protein Sango_1744400 [Sesamum angolense]|uniref:Integrase catalytic domain-containing protein n=1 Tax=Sesamum angolense TaxID=2727404 RepID=A0AAE2BS89_9LAMI|nr:hypothetical protein Sango_1744400 [Sesamum angolense]